MRQGCLVLAVGRVRSKEREGKKITRSPTKHQKTHHEIYLQQPGDRDHLETATGETGPTRSVSYTHLTLPTNREV